MFIANLSICIALFRNLSNSRFGLVRRKIVVLFSTTLWAGGIYKNNQPTILLLASPSLLTRNHDMLPTLGTFNCDVGGFHRLCLLFALCQ